MSTFGSTQEEELPDEGMIIAKRTARNAATMTGMNIELQLQKQRIEDLYKKLESLHGMYNTLLNRYNTLEAQRAVELSRMYGNGPTEL